MLDYFACCLLPAFVSISSRYQYDPNPRVSEAMSHIWHALVPEPKKTVDANFAPIAVELLKEMGGRLWRNREASCAGMADLLQVASSRAALLDACQSYFPRVVRQGLGFIFKTLKPCKYQ